MRSDIKEILTDINAALRIQHPESILFALDKILDLPEVTGNQVLEEVSITNIVLPIGNRLSEKSLPDEIYNILVEAEFAVFRALAAVIAAGRYCSSDDLDQTELLDFAQDRRDVGLALSLALAEKEETGSEKLLGLIDKWIVSRSISLLTISLNLITSVINADNTEILEKVGGLSDTNDPDLKRTLADTLIKIAQKGFDSQVLSLLETWEFETGEKDWIALRALSASWSVKFEDRTLKIIEKITMSMKEDRQIVKTLSALKRNGAKNIDMHIENWKNSGDLRLQKTAEAYFAHETKGKDES
jgi:hypothetical protein